MDVKKAVKYIDGQIEVLEKSLYYFDTVMRPRVDRDREILAELKVQAVRLDAIKQKIERGESITDEEIRDGVPAMFR